MNDVSNFTIKASLSELIVFHRRGLHLSQAELAKDVGVSRNYISLIERGNTESVSYKVLKKICFRLGLKIEVTFDHERKIVK